MKTLTNQFIATAIVNLLALSHGFVLGWSSPATKYFSSDESHLNGGKADATSLSWVGSAISIGALFATLTTGFISDRIGKKNTLMLLAVPNLIFWIMTYVCKEITEIIVGRFIAGMTGGGIFRILALYIADIAENRLRGGLSSIFPFTMYTGILIMFIFGAFLDYFTISIISMVVPILGFILMIFLPETPHFYIERENFDEAFMSLKFYRSYSGNTSADELKVVHEEFEILKNGVLNAKSEKVRLKDFTSKSAKFGISVGMYLTFLLTLSGNSVIMMYTASIFSITGSTLSPDNSAIVIAAMQIFGILLMGLMVDRIGRKILMIISCAGSTVTLMILAIYLLFKQDGTDLTHMYWVPIVLLSFGITSQSLGISSLPFVMISELVPFKIRETCALICMVFVAILMFAMLKIFPDAVIVCGLSACFWFFGTVCFIGLIIGIFFMPETKGKDVLKD